MQTNIIWVAFLILGILLIRELFIYKKHMLEREFLISMWLLNIDELEKRGANMLSDKQLVIDHLTMHKITISEELVKVAGSDWLPGYLIKK